jgi:hypothetical protein
VRPGTEPELAPAAGHVLADDATVPDDAELWRRVPPGPEYVVFDQTLGRHRPSSGAFDNDTDTEEMSVFLAAEAADPAVVLEGHSGYAVAALIAGLLRAEGQVIVRDPTPQGPRGHALVIGRKSHGLRVRLARAARWVVPP